MTVSCVAVAVALFDDRCRTWARGEPLAARAALVVGEPLPMKKSAGRLRFSGHIEPCELCRVCTIPPRSSLDSKARFR